DSPSRNVRRRPALAAEVEVDRIPELLGEIERLRRQAKGAPHSLAPRAEGRGLGHRGVRDRPGWLSVGVRRAVSPWPLVGLAAESPCGILSLRLCLPDPVILAAEIELDRITELLGEDRPPYASQARRPGE